MALLSLFAKLGLDKTGFDAGMTAATKQGEKFGGDLKSAIAGAFTVGAITAYLRSVVELITHVKDMSEQFGITAEEVQRTDFAMNQSGLQIENLSTSLAKLGNARKDAVEGNLELRGTFEKYGITLDDLNNSSLRSYDIFLKMAKALSGVTLSARDQVELMDLLGPKALKLANIMGDMANHPPPLLIRQEDVERLDEAVKLYEKLALTAKLVGAKVATGYLDNLKKIPEALKSGNLKEVGYLLFPGTAAGEAGGDIGLRDPLKDVAKRIGGSILNPLMKQIFPGEGLFETDKNSKQQPFGIFDFINMSFRKASEFTKLSGGATGIDSDQFQRIGAFTSGGPQANQTAAIDRMETQIRELRRDLTSKGILVKGAD